jgi:histidinol-phosphate aminotransferase
VRRDPASAGGVLILRTLSKFGLAGVRIGYLMGAARLIEQIDKVRPPYNVSVLNAECALFALQHAEVAAVYARQAEQIKAERGRLIEVLGQLPGVTAYPSQGNMILTRVPDAARAFAGMKARGVLVKNISTMHPLLANCLRLTVGTTEENARMLAALRDSL